MEEEIMAAAKHVILLVVIVAIVIAIAIVAQQRFEALKGETETVGASGFKIKLGQPTMKCEPSGWVINFGQFNVTDPDKRNITVMPLIAFGEGRNFGFAAKRDDMDGATVAGKLAGLIRLNAGTGGAASLDFQKSDFALGGADAFPARGTLNARIGFWIWTGDAGCLSQAIMNKGYGAANLSDILVYTTANCPAMYIGVMYRNLTNANC